MPRRKLITLPSPDAPAIIQVIRDNAAMPFGREALPMQHEQCYAYRDGDDVLSVLELGRVHEDDRCPVCGALLRERAGQSERVEQLCLWVS